jgi:hypothetical protein
MRSWREAVDGLLADLRGVFGGRLVSLAVYEAHGALGEAPAGGDDDVRHDGHVHAFAVVDVIGHADLARLAAFARDWDRRGLTVPLVLGAGELRESLDAFPLEFAQMIARHVTVAGDDPFAGLAVDDADLRRACETQARSHLLHLRQGFIQADNDPGALARLVAASAAPLRALLVSIARLHGVGARTPDALLRFAEERLHLPAESLRPVVSHGHGQRLDSLDAGAFFPGYLQAVEHLVTQVNQWAR